MSVTPEELDAFLSMRSLEVRALTGERINAYQAALRNERTYAGQTLTLLREWFSTEIDSEDEEYGPWIASFTARVVAALAKNPVNAEPSASTQSAGTMESALNPGPPSTRKCNHCAFEFVCAEDGERWCPACQSFDTRQIGHEIGTTDQRGSAKAAGAPGAESTATPTICHHPRATSDGQCLSCGMPVSDAHPVLAVDTGNAVVPIIPTESQWGGLARDVFMWLDMGDRDRSGASLLEHLTRLHDEIPAWLMAECEKGHLAKGDRAAIVYRAMVEAAPQPVLSQGTQSKEQTP